MQGLKNFLVLFVPALYLWFVLSGADGYLYQIEMLPLRPGIAKAALLIPMFIMIVATQYLKDGGVRLLAVYRENLLFLGGMLFLAVIQTVWAFHGGAYWDDGGYLALRQLILFLTVLLIMPIALLQPVMNGYRKIALGALSVFLITMAIDVLKPGTYSSTGLGAAGWAENPNYAAGAVLALSILAADWKRYRRSDWLIWSAAGVLVVLAGSRSGVIMWVVSVVYWHRQFFKGLFKIGSATLAFAIILMLSVLLIHYTASEPYISSYLESKFASFTGLEDLLRGERLELARHYLDLINERPLVGHGAWFWMRDETGSHNVFLMLWASNGIMGILSYLVFLMLAGINAYRQSDNRSLAMIVVIFIVQGVFSHMLVVRDLFFVALTLSVCLAWAGKSVMYVEQKK